MRRVVGAALGLALGLALIAPGADAQPAKKAPPAKATAAKPAKKSAGSPPAAPASKKAAKTKSTTSNKAGRKPGTERGSVNPDVRSSISGENAPPPPPKGDVASIAPRPIGASAKKELDAMKEVDGLLFPDARATDGIGVGSDAPKVEVKATGLPAETVLGAKNDAPVDVTDLSWLTALDKPDIPFRWDPRLIKYLDYFKNDPKGRAMVAGLLKRSGRYLDEVQKRLRARNMPEDIAWLSLIESGMDPRIASHAGAAGLWQFMPKAGTAYGLRVDKWVDERLDPERSTEAALDYLSDLKTRFGRWELAFAAYNMGHGGLLTSIRKYNTNDYWALSSYEDGVPYETALYVPKILALAFVARNRAVFGVDKNDVDPAEPFAPAAKDTSKQAKAAPGKDAKPADKSKPAKDDAATKLSFPGTVDYTIRWGESLEAIALDHGTTESKLRAINGILSPVPPRPGTVLSVPGATSKPASSNPFVAVVPPGTQSMPDRKRVLYEVVWGDQLDDVARALGVSAGEICQWNNIDPTARLHGKMVLEAFVPKDEKLADVRLVDAKSATVLTVNSQEFFDFFESKNGRKRVTFKAAKGDTWAGIAKKHGISVALLERINQRSRLSKLAEGEQVVVYTRSTGAIPAPKPTIEDSTYDESAAMLDAPNSAASASDTDAGPVPLILED